jgi:hypothetical protein
MKKVSIPTKFSKGTFLIIQANTPWSFPNWTKKLKKSRSNSHLSQIKSENSKTKRPSSNKKTNSSTKTTKTPKRNSKNSKTLSSKPPKTKRTQFITQRNQIPHRQALTIHQNPQAILTLKIITTCLPQITLLPPTKVILTPQKRSHHSQVQPGRDKKKV